jgi:hypothetical protein
MPAFDPGAEVTQLAIDPSALGHVGDGQTALLVEGDVADAALSLVEIVAAGIAAIGGHLAGRRAAVRDVAVEHRQEPLDIGRITDLDDEIEDQAALNRLLCSDWPKGGCPAKHVGAGRALRHRGTAARLGGAP